MTPEQIKERRKKEGEPYTIGETRLVVDEWFKRSERSRNLNIPCDYATTHLRIVLEKLDQARRDLVKISRSAPGFLSGNLAEQAIERIDDPVWPEWEK